MYIRVDTPQCHFGVCLGGMVVTHTQNFIFVVHHRSHFVDGMVAILSDFGGGFKKFREMVFHLSLATVVL